MARHRIFFISVKVQTGIKEASTIEEDGGGIELLLELGATKIDCASL